MEFIINVTDEDGTLHDRFRLDEQDYRNIAEFLSTFDLDNEEG